MIYPISTATTDRGDPFFYGVKCVYPSQAVISKKAYVLNFISKWIFLVIYPFNSNGVDFPTTSFISVDKMCFPSSSLWEFSQKMLTWTILSQNGEGPDPIPFWWFILSISMATMDRGRFSSHFLLSEDKMCFSFFRLWEFSEKMLTWTILSQNGEGPEHDFFGDLYFQFQGPNWNGVDFSPTSFYP